MYREDSGISSDVHEVETGALVDDVHRDHHHLDDDHSDDGSEAERRRMEFMGIGGSGPPRSSGGRGNDDGGDDDDESSAASDATSVVQRHESGLGAKCKIICRILCPCCDCCCKEGSLGGRGRRCGRKVIICSVLLTVILIGGGATGAYFGLKVPQAQNNSAGEGGPVSDTKGDDNTSSTENTTLSAEATSLAPSLAPSHFAATSTFAPTNSSEAGEDDGDGITAVDFLIRKGVLEGEDDGTPVLDPGSPQEKALKWIVEEDGRKLDPSDSTLPQRFVLATLFFGSSGEFWENSAGWLSAESECEWAGVVCILGDDEKEESDSTNGTWTNGTEAPVVSGFSNETLGEGYLITNTTSANGSTAALVPNGGENESELLVISGDSVKGGMFPKDPGSRMRHRTTSFPRFRDAQHQQQAAQSPGTAREDDFSSSKEGSVSSLDLRNNNVEGPIPEEMGRALPYLRFLDLGSNAMTGTLPETLGLLDNLEEIFLEENFFKGSLPQSIVDLTKLVQLDVSHNTLMGAVPSRIGQLSELKVLRLSHNNFNGTIPDSMGNLTNLVELALADNENLDRNLPTSLCNLNVTDVPWCDEEAGTVVRFRRLLGPRIRRPGLSLRTTYLRKRGEHFSAGKERKNH